MSRWQRMLAAGSERVNNASVTMDEQSCARGRARRGGVTGGLSAAARGRRHRAGGPAPQDDGKMGRRVRTEAVYASGAWLTNLVVRGMSRMAMHHELKL